MSQSIRAPAPDGVRLRRDDHGVPHVVAADLHAAHWGLGYVHALDRGLQMCLMRILGQGRAAECLKGTDELVTVDRFFRRMGWTASPGEVVDQLDPECRSLAQRYCDGVNARLQSRRPWELRVVGYEPEPWRIEDILLLTRMTGYVTLAQSQAEVERLFVEMVQGGVPDEHLDALFPGNLGGFDRALVERITLGERVVPDELRWLSPIPPMKASNAWAVSGKRTATGQALLANDPHLEINRLPAVWIEQVVELPEGSWLGAGMPGLPAMLVGRSPRLAWGATYGFADAVDSWVEECQGGCARRQHNEWKAFQVRSEVIRRKGGADEIATFFENEHGVLDGDPRVPGYYLATRWAAADSGAKSLVAMKDMWSATNVAEAMDCLGRVEACFCWVLADDEGHIGFQMSGAIPDRHPEATGFVPMPGWQAEYDWRGFLDPRDLPRACDPEAGFVVTANQNLNLFGQAAPINMAMGDHRARRIAQLLETADKIDTATCERIHMDVYSLQAAEIMAVVRPHLPSTETGRLLAKWDCRYDPDSRGPVAFELYYDALISEVFSPTLGEGVLGSLTRGASLFVDFYQNVDRILLAETSPWHGERSRDEVFKAAARALPETVDVTWGEKNEITFTNIFFSGRLPKAFAFDRGPIPLRGGRATPHQGQVFESAGRTTTFAPSIRLIADMAEDTLRTALPGGPQDRRFSRWYTSGLEDWLAGRYKTVRPTTLPGA